jgi:hypothetical protein
LKFKRFNFFFIRLAAEFVFLTIIRKAGSSNWLVFFLR